MPDRRVQRAYEVFRLLGITTSVALAASAIVTALGTAYLLDIDGREAVLIPEPKAAKTSKGGKGDSVVARAHAARVKAKREAVATITGRGVFCPTCVPEAPMSDPVVPTTPTRPGVAPGEQPTALKLRLVATLEPVGEGHALATIYDAEQGINGLFGIGDPVRGGVVVERIDHGLVHLRNGAALEYLEIGGTVPRDDKKTATKKEPTKKKRPNKRAIPGADDAIDCKTKDVCTVERGFVDKVVANPALLAKQARVVPSRKDGETRGYKLYGIRRGTLPKLLGFRNGDMIAEINGHSLTSIDAAMGLYARLRRASHLEVEFVRKGKRRTKEINII